MLYLIVRLGVFVRDVVLNSKLGQINSLRPEINIYLQLQRYEILYLSLQRRACSCITNAVWLCIGPPHLPSHKNSILNFLRSFSYWIFFYQTSAAQVATLCLPACLKRSSCIWWTPETLSRVSCSASCEQKLKGKHKLHHTFFLCFLSSDKRIRGG